MQAEMNSSMQQAVFITKIKTKDGLWDFHIDYVRPKRFEKLPKESFEVVTRRFESVALGLAWLKQSM